MKIKQISKWVLVGAVSIFFIWLIVLNSTRYKLAISVLGNKNVLAMTGEVRLSLLTGFSIKSAQGRSSIFSIFIIGERESGFLKVEIENQTQGPVLELVTFKDREIKLE